MMLTLSLKSWIWFKLNVEHCVIRSPVKACSCISNLCSVGTLLKIALTVYSSTLTGLVVGRCVLIRILSGTKLALKTPNMKAQYER